MQEALGDTSTVWEQYWQGQEIRLGSVATHSNECGLLCSLRYSFQRVGAKQIWHSGLEQLTWGQLPSLSLNNAGERARKTKQEGQDNDVLTASAPFWTGWCHDIIASSVQLLFPNGHNSYLIRLQFLGEVREIGNLDVILQERERKRERKRYGGPKGEFCKQSCSGSTWNQYSRHERGIWWIKFNEECWGCVLNGLTLHV